MQQTMKFLHRSEEEDIKEAGMMLDFDEIAKKGGLTKEEKLIAKWYGVYASRHPGAHMARIVIPGGVISSAQARNIARVSEKYAQGLISVTTRQALQLHWLKAGDLADIFRELAREGNTTLHGCGDVTRIIASCPLSETCRYRRLNVRPWAIKAQKFLGEDDDLNDLPRKFKITFSGCGACCAQPFMNCIGNIGVQRIVEPGKERAVQTMIGFKVVIGGGMGWKAFVAQELFSFVPEALILRVNRAIALMYRDHGDRFDRTLSRLKFVVERLGIDHCRELVLDYLRAEKVPVDNLLTAHIKDTGLAWPERPLTEEDPVGTDDLHTIRLMIPIGELNYRELHKIAELSEVYGDQKIYTTNRQNIELHGVETRNIEALKAEIRALGFETEGFFGLKDIVPCVGTTYCPKAVGTTHDLYRKLQDLVRQERFKSIEKFALINITGCPNSCSPYRIVDIGFRGMRIREELGSVEGYEMLIGGSELDHGKKLGDFKTEDCVVVTETVLETFATLRQDGETLTRCAQRVGIEPFKEAVYQ